MTSQRASVSNIAQFIPSKTGDNGKNYDSNGKNHLTTTNHGKLISRRGSHLEPELMTNLEALRLRSPSPTSTQRKYVKLRNVMDSRTAMDTLHRQSAEVRFLKRICIHVFS